MIQLIEDIIKSLVADKANVKLDVSEEENKVNVVVNVSEQDIGRIIGKEGATITAIRTLLKNTNNADGKRYFIQIGGGPPHRDKERTRPHRAERKDRR